MSYHRTREGPPILCDKHPQAASAFTPQNLLREARRQKGVPDAPTPEVCILDPDGDIVRFLRAAGRSRPVDGWACYHSEMDCFVQGGREFGIIGCAVGAPYAVLVAEQMFASGCRLLISITSSGQITALRPPPYFVLIERALRDEAPAIITLLLRTTQRLTPLWWRRSAQPLRRWVNQSSAARPGQPMRLIGRPRKPLRRRALEAYWRSRWRRRRSMRSPRRGAKPCSASPM